ncbi:hypothetical protein HOY82DRAFT_578874 [Tuber indicum]|nr:hypothetical protein HOY82DRAFT_578874 [Tuber indicum]
MFHLYPVSKSTIGERRRKKSESESAAGRRKRYPTTWWQGTGAPPFNHHALRHVGHRVRHLYSLLLPPITVLCCIVSRLRCFSSRVIFPSPFPPLLPPVAHRKLGRQPASQVAK